MSYFEIRKSSKGQFHWLELGPEGVHERVEEERHDKMIDALNAAYKEGARPPLGYVGRPADKVYD